MYMSARLAWRWMLFATSSYRIASHPIGLQRPIAINYRWKLNDLELIENLKKITDCKSIKRFYSQFVTDADGNVCVCVWPQPTATCIRFGNACIRKKIKRRKKHSRARSTQPYTSSMKEESNSRTKKTCEMRKIYWINLWMWHFAMRAHILRRCI